jgi:hypothetical protein
MVKAHIGVPCSTNVYCLDVYGCAHGLCPTFTIKRHDTQPPFRLEIKDCDGFFDLNDPLLVAEVNMWANAKFKKSVLATDTSFAVADNIGFYQCFAGDIIIVNHPRNPEHMLVTGFDEINNLIQVQRGFNNTTASPWNRGNSIRIFRTLNSPVGFSSVFTDIQREDGTIQTDVLTGSYLVYNWGPNDTCLAGCYWLEFKLLKMLPPLVVIPPSDIPSVTYPMDASCSLGSGVEWVRRFPENETGFLVKIVDSPTQEF